MSTVNYYQHDLQYQNLRKNGFSGWGAESFDRRMQGWNATVATLTQSEVFPKIGSNILELGSGAGDSLMPFAELGYQVTGIEISPTAVEWAREKFLTKNLHANFLTGNIAEKLPFANASFDVVIDAACLHCLIGDDRKFALTEVRQVLKPQGFLLISHMVNDPRELGTEFTFNPITRVQERLGIAYRAMPTLKQLVNELNEAGFKIIKQTIRENTWWDHAEIWCQS